MTASSDAVPPGPAKRPRPLISVVSNVLISRRISPGSYFVKECNVRETRAKRRRRVVPVGERDDGALCRERLDQLSVR